MNCLICNCDFDSKYSWSWCENCKVDNCRGIAVYFRLNAINLDVISLGDYFITRDSVNYYDVMYFLVNKTLNMDLIHISIANNLFHIPIKKIHKRIHLVVDIKPSNLIEFVKKILKKQYLL